MNIILMVLYRATWIRLNHKNIIGAFRMETRNIATDYLVRFEPDHTFQEAMLPRVRSYRTSPRGAFRVAIAVLAASLVAVDSSFPVLSASSPVTASLRSGPLLSPSALSSRMSLGPKLNRFASRVNSEAEASEGAQLADPGEKDSKPIPEAFNHQPGTPPAVGRPPTPLLDMVQNPKNLKNLNMQQLKQLSKELRSDVIHTVSKTGGHLGASLGVRNTHHREDR
eukprot:jgi/Bigna1/82512/fgenesh1_pg.93_\